MSSEIVDGLIYESHMKKVKELETWHLNPFKPYSFKKLRGASYRMMKRELSSLCSSVGCMFRANRKCVYKTCKSCCATKGGICSAHGRKSLYVE